MGRLGDHPNIVTIYEYGDHEGQPYMVLPLMPGGDVEELIEKAPQHRLPIERAVGIAKCVCLGLEFAHSKGIIHRDLKPGNVWLAADGTAKIGNFGLAVAVDLSRLTREGMMAGTAFYMPPEQAMGREVTPRVDLYLLKVKDEVPDLPNTETANVGGNVISYQEFPEEVECSDGKADCIRTLTLGLCIETVALYEAIELCYS